MKLWVYLVLSVPLFFFGIECHSNQHTDYVDECEACSQNLLESWCDECKDFNKNPGEFKSRIYHLKIKNDIQEQEGDPDARYICVKADHDVANPPKKYFLRFEEETPYIASKDAGGEINYKIDIVREKFGNCIHVGGFVYHIPKTVSGSNTVYIRKRYTREGDVELWAEWLWYSQPGKASPHWEYRHIGTVDRSNW